MDVLTRTIVILLAVSFVVAYLISGISGYGLMAVGFVLATFSAYMCAGGEEVEK